ncbi:TPA: hypothetical protein ACXHW4_004688 [Enterobacter hormaechei]
MIKLLVTEKSVDFTHLQLKELLVADHGDKISNISPELFYLIEHCISLIPEDILKQLVIYNNGEVLEAKDGVIQECSVVLPALLQEFKAKLGIIDYDHVLSVALDMLNDDSISLRHTKDYIQSKIKYCITTTAEMVPELTTSYDKIENQTNDPCCDSDILMDTNAQLLESELLEINTMLDDKPVKVQKPVGITRRLMNLPI